MPEPEPPSSSRRRSFPWRSAFERSDSPIYVVGPTRRLRYANPAWEKLTGRPLGNVRGMRITTRKSAGALAQTLAVPPEVWEGRVATVRRAVPTADSGPPWWDITFLPLTNGGKPLAIAGQIAVVGTSAGRGSSHKIPTALAELRRQHGSHFSLDLLAGRSAASERLVAQARLAGSTDAPLWIVGEAGTGKETVARVVHHTGLVRDRAFLGLDCVGLQPYLLEAVLFGRGGLAGSGHTGTVFLREPAALPRDLQDRIVRSVNPLSPGGPRLICASTRPAAEDVAAGKLLPIFHTTLSVLEIRVPPLRDRADDLARLASRLLERFPEPGRLSDDAVTVLRSHDWPGNLRELGQILSEASRLAGKGPIERSHLPRFLQERHLIAETPAGKPGKSWNLDGVLEAVEKRLLETALRQSGNSQTAAAEKLGIFRARLWRRMEALGIDAPPQPPKSRKKSEGEAGGETARGGNS